MYTLVYPAENPTQAFVGVSVLFAACAADDENDGGGGGGGVGSTVWKNLAESSSEHRSPFAEFDVAT